MVKPDFNIRDHYRYDAFGKPAPGNTKLSSDGANVLHNTFGYTGEIWDEESNLLYLRARYYEPETGRFLSRDTYAGEVENPLSRNLYAYTQNNPVNWVDPSGNWAEVVHKELTRDIIDSFVKRFGSTSFGKFLKDHKQYIVDHANDPDNSFRNWVGFYHWNDHFYNPDTGGNYDKNDKLGIAPVRVKEYMEYAASGYDSIRHGLIAHEFAKAIAKALHYLEDMSNPYHTSDKTALNSDHSSYEKWAEKIIKNKTVPVDTRVGNYEQIAKNLAQKSHNDAINKWNHDTKYVDEWELPVNIVDLNKYFDWARSYGTRVLYTLYESV